LAPFGAVDSKLMETLDDDEGLLKYSKIAP